MGHYSIALARSLDALSDPHNPRAVSMSRHNGDNRHALLIASAFARFGCSVSIEYPRSGLRDAPRLDHPYVVRDATRPSRPVVGVVSEPYDGRPVSRDLARQLDEFCKRVVRGGATWGELPVVLWNPTSPDSSAVLIFRRSKGAPTIRLVELDDGDRAEARALEQRYRELERQEWERVLSEAEAFLAEAEAVYGPPDPERIAERVAKRVWDQIVDSLTNPPAPARAARVA